MGNVGTTEWREAFHAHLDTCSQCRNHPGDLCDTGHRLLTGEEQERTPDSAADDLAAFRSWLTELVGHTEEECRAVSEQSGLQFRVTRRDGKERAVTQEFHPFRVNVRVEAGKVVEAYGG